MSVDRDGELIESLGPGDFFGEMAILGSGRRNATVTASTRVERSPCSGRCLARWKPITLTWRSRSGERSRNASDADPA